VWGEKFLPNKNLTDGIWAVDSLATEIGFRSGDKIISIDGKVPERLEDIYQEVLFGGTVKVMRNNQVDSFVIPNNFIDKYVKERNILLFYPRIPFIFREVPDTSINFKSGIQEKDQVLRVNGVPVKYYDEFLSMSDTLKPGMLDVLVLRKGDTIPLSLQLSEKKKLEVFTFIPSEVELDKLGIYKLETHTFTLAQSIPAGLKKAGDRLGFYIRQLKLIFEFKSGAYKGLGGFGTIGGLFPKEWSWQAFWEITAFLSLILAFMNILPIPALDGGHVAFLLYEIITRRQPSEKFMERAQVVGMVIIFGLLIFANTNDILRWIENMIHK
jgi:regulator of sigma E protease